MIILNIFKVLKETMFKELKESMTAMSHQIENFSNEIEIIFFKNQRNSRVEKYSNWNEKYLLEGMNNRLKESTEKEKQLEGRSIDYPVWD